MTSASAPTSLRDVIAVAPNINRNYTGVTATICNLVPVQARAIGMVAMGPNLPDEVPQLPWRALMSGWSRPPGHRQRIWHARRKDEAIVGILLRSLLRQRWKLVFTAAAARPKKGFTRFLFRQMDAMIATMPEVADYIDGPSTVIMHGVDTTRFQPAPDREAAWRATGLPGRYGIGVFGRIRPQKGTDLFVEAMCRLLPRYPDATAVLSGHIGAEHTGYEGEIRARINEAGLAERIVFLGDLPIDEIPLWYRRISLYVAPMRWEGFGLTPLEAMASGTAVVSTRTGAAHHLIRDGVTGTLVPAKDIDALTDAIDARLADIEGTLAMGRVAREHVVAHHSIEREAEAINAVYAQLWDR
ncbi:glycosyltransferase family 4 protein [Ancylobacter terrae]|uniref:glycosyltransferase family 4 protein n=1 Tax=Ancylobacter sp. sgz301288 TaxID=3342077 RepID=UPI00385EC986